MTRRELLALAAARAASAFAPSPAAVSIARVQSYTEDLSAVLGTMFDQLGGLGKLAGGKTVTVKLNLTGPPGNRIQGRPLGVTHYVHPRVVLALTSLLGRAGARRIRLVESCWATGGPLEEVWWTCGWNPRHFLSAAPNVELENTNNLGRGRRYARLKVPGQAYTYPAFDLNHCYEETDVFVSLAKLKNHATCGVTLSLKNIFGITPASMYGDDAGRDEPNENPTKGRGDSLHFAKRKISRAAPQEIAANPSHDPGYRVPHIVADLAAARPIELAIIDGIESIAGGEGPWVGRGIRLVQPGLLIAGTNPVATDAVASAAMGYDPRAPRGTTPFTHCDNTLLLAEAKGLGTADLTKIEVRGAALREVMYPFG